MTVPPKDTYQAYLLRLQRSSVNDPWRGSLENAHTGELHRFGSEQELFRYLKNSLSTTEKEQLPIFPSEAENETP